MARPEFESAGEYASLVRRICHAVLARHCPLATVAGKRDCGPRIIAAGRVVRRGGNGPSSTLAIGLCGLFGRHLSARLVGFENLAIRTLFHNFYAARTAVSLI